MLRYRFAPAHILYMIYPFIRKSSPTDGAGLRWLAHSHSLPNCLSSVIHLSGVRIRATYVEAYPYPLGYCPLNNLIMSHYCYSSSPCLHALQAQFARLCISAIKVGRRSQIIIHFYVTQFTRSPSAAQHKRALYFAQIAL